MLRGTQVRASGPPEVYPRITDSVVWSNI